MPPTRILLSVTRRLLVLLFLLLLAVPAMAQRGGKEPKILILQVVDATVQPPRNDTVFSNLARAKLIQAINEKALESVSPALAQATADVEKIDLGDPTQWTKDTFKTIARAAKVQFVGAIVLRSLSDTADPLGAAAQASGWLYEARFDRFIFDNKEVTFAHAPKANGAEPPGAMVLRIGAVGGAAQEIFKSFLAEQPKKKKKKKFGEPEPVDRIK